jgi:N-acyl-D-amino-acid deacylase
MDIVIRGATVVDGTGSPGVHVEVGIEAGRIAAVGDGLTGSRVIDATGLVLAPGFIDMHAHSDIQVLARPDHLAKISQGVTTEVVGQDGLSYAPVDETTLAALRTQLVGWNEDPEGFDWDWRGVGEYLDRLDRGVTTNIAYLLPQGTIRMLVLGWDARPATESEVDRMREIVATGMAEGALGLSSGLTYTPGMYASTDELVALCEVVAGSAATTARTTAATAPARWRPTPR